MFFMTYCRVSRVVGSAASDQLLSVADCLASLLPPASVSVDQSKFSLCSGDRPLGSIHQASRFSAPRLTAPENGTTATLAGSSEPAPVPPKNFAAAARA